MSARQNASAPLWPHHALLMSRASYDAASAFHAVKKPMAIENSAVTPPSPAQLAVFGTGLVGCYLGAAAGATLAFPGTSRRLRAQRVRLPAGERHWSPVLGTSRAASRAHGPVLVACRVHQTPWQQLPSNVLLAQNGLGQRLPVMTCFFALDEIEPGVITAIGPSPRVVLEPGHRSWQPILDAWQEAGIEVSVVANARPAQWEKAIFNATVGPLCLATGLSMASVWRDEALRRLCLDATREGGQIAAACGIIIPEGLDERAQRFFSLVGAHQPSVLRDHGELPAVIGQLLSHAQSHGIAVVALLKIHGQVERVLQERAARAVLNGGKP